MPEPQPTQSEAQSGSAMHLWLVALASIIAHVPALRAGFVLDDRSLLSDNPYVRTASGLGVLLRHELFVASAQPRIVPYYRPLSGLLNWLSFQALGANAPLQHALNLVLHAAVALLLGRTLESFRVRPGIARGLALLFAVHPATAEVVAYLGGRQDLLGWLVALTSLLLMQRIRPIGALAVLGFGACLIGALCHEFFLAWPLPLALLAMVGADWGGARRVLSRGAATMLGGALAVPTLLLIRHWLRLIDFEVQALGFFNLVRATVGVAARLAKDVLWPTDLAVDVTVASPNAAIASGIWVLAGVVTFVLAREVGRRGRAMFWLLLAGISVMVLVVGLHSGVALKYGNISDRYAYALLVGASFACAALMECWTPLASTAESPLAAIARRWAGIALAIALLPLTWSRDTSWHDEESLQLAMIADRPDDPETHLAAGMLHFAYDDLEQAYPHCVAYRKARPQSEKANLCLGTWLLLHRQPAEAVQILRPYALSRPGMQRARRTFLAALFANRDYGEARTITDEWSRQFPGAVELAEANQLLATKPLNPPPSAASHENPR